MTSNKSHTINHIELEEEIQFEEQLPDHHYRTEIPNIIFELRLSPTDFAVYCFIKRITGDTGKCWKSIKNLSIECGIGTCTVRKSLAFLSKQTFPEFGIHQPLIKIKSRKKADKSNDTNIITIQPIWRLNGDFYRSKKKEKTQGEDPKNERGGVLYKIEGGTLNNRPKEEHIKKSVVVVKGGGDPPDKLKKPKENKMLTKDDIYFRVNKTGKKWSSDEIDEAYIAYNENRPDSISDHFAYFEGIVIKKRIQKEISEQAKERRYSTHEERMKKNTHTERAKKWVRYPTKPEIKKVDPSLCKEGNMGRDMWGRRLPKSIGQPINAT